MEIVVEKIHIKIVIRHKPQGKVRLSMIYMNFLVARVNCHLRASCVLNVRRIIGFVGLKWVLANHCRKEWGNLIRAPQRTLFMQNHVKTGCCRCLRSWNTCRQVIYVAREHRHHCLISTWKVRSARKVEEYITFQSSPLSDLYFTQHMRFSKNRNCMSDIIFEDILNVTVKKHVYK